MENSIQDKVITGTLIIICIILSILIVFKMKSDLPDIYGAKNETNTAEFEKTEKKVEQAGRENLIFVHICGNVKNPGVYSFPKATITARAIEAAGGLTESACSDYINLAKILKNEDKIRVPSKTAASKTDRKQEVTDYVRQDKEDVIEEIELSPGDKMVNLNLADQKTIESIPGIGNKTAEKIIAYREKSGWLQSIEEIENIPGIRKKTIEKCRKYIFIE